MESLKNIFIWVRCWKYGAFYYNKVDEILASDDDMMVMMIVILVKGLVIVIKTVRIIIIIIIIIMMMTTLPKGLFSVMLKFPSLPVKNPNW